MSVYTSVVGSNLSLLFFSNTLMQVRVGFHLEKNDKLSIYF